MKCVAVFKWAMNPQDERVGSSGEVKWRAKRPEAGDDDYRAVQIAEACAEGDEFFGLTSSSGDVAFAAARGAGATYTYKDLPVDAEPTRIAHVLAAAVREIGDVDVVAIGDGVWAPEVASLLAGLLGIQAVLGVDDAHIEDGKVMVTRRFGAGLQTLSVPAPVVLGVTARREEENKPGMRTVLQARKKPVHALELAGLDESEGHTSSVIGMRKPDAHPATIYDGSDLDEAINHVIKGLKVEGVL